MNKKSTHVSRRTFLGSGGALIASTAIPVLGDAVLHEGSPLKQKNVTVSLIADTLASLGQEPMRLSMSEDIKPLTTLTGTVIGPAITTKWEVGRSRSTAEEIRRFVFEPLDQAQPGSVWVVASGTERILSMFGDIIGQACHSKGILGAVTDSGCRDLAGMSEIGFPVFGKASVPFGPGNFIHPVAANVPVICGGVEVKPGDLVAADLDGVVVIPAELMSGLYEALAAQLNKEQEMRRKLDAGESLVKAHSL